MKITYDPVKNEKNIRERGLSFEKVHEFDFANAAFLVDDRKDYGELRIRAYGKIADRVHVVVYKHMTEDDIRIISFRKANKREVNFYEKTQSRDD
ncbi:MAG: BrnT family toxin [Bacteroides sp.]|nr:BrnT family toxin [Bacteroides sp.]